MATLKIKFRASTVENREGTIFYQIIHNRIVRQKNTDYHIYIYEWDSKLSEIILPKFDTNRKSYLQKISNNIQNDIKLFYEIITYLNSVRATYTADDIIDLLQSNASENYFFVFMEKIAVNLKTLGKIRTSETYTTTLNSFKRFRGNKDLILSDIDSSIILAYEAYLKNNGICLNTSSFYMRNLRAVYNRAVEQNLTIQKYPFKHVYTGIDKTTKRAVSLSVIKQIKNIDLSTHSSLEFARDMFLFSFYTRGMSFIDMAYLRKKDLNNGILSYRRRKTGQQLFIKWEKCMQEIVDKYWIKESIYLMPVIQTQSNIDERKQYIYTAHNINQGLKIIGKKLELPIPLTMYVSRHTWASIARSKNIPISVISEGMGHNSEATTRIYLASLDTTAIDKANSLILNSL